MSTEGGTPASLKGTPAETIANCRVRILELEADRAALMDLLGADGEPETWHILNAYLRGVRTGRKAEIAKQVRRRRRDIAARFKAGETDTN